MMWAMPVFWVVSYRFVEWLCCTGIAVAAVAVVWCCLALSWCFSLPFSIICYSFVMDIMYYTSDNYPTLNVFLGIFLMLTGGLYAYVFISFQEVLTRVVT